MKILFCAESLDMNGAMKSLVTFMSVLVQRGYDISLCCYSHDGILMPEIPKEVKVLPEQPAWAVFRLSFVVGLKYALKKGRIDLFLLRLLVPLFRWLHLPGGRFLWYRPRISGTWDVALAYADGFIAPATIQKVTAKHKYLWVHTDYRICPESLSVARAFKQATGAVAVSQDAADGFRVWYEKLMGEPYSHPVHVIYNIIDAASVKALAITAPEIPPQKHSVRLVTVGRVTPQKNQDSVPFIAEKLRAQGVDFEWVLVGGGQMWQKVQADIDALGLTDCVFFTGEVTNPMGWVMSADIVVQPSRWEGWGMTVSEALILKKPVVVSNIAVFREQVVEGENGLLAPLDHETLAKTISRLVEDKRLRAKMNAYQCDYPFSADAVCQQFAKVLVHV